MNVAFSKVEVSACGLSLVQRSVGECCVSERDRRGLENEETLAPKGLPTMPKVGGGEVY